MHLSAAVLNVSMIVGLAASAQAQVWLGSYDPALGTFPSAQGWQLVEFQGVSPAPTVSGGVLRQGPTSFDGYQYWTRSDIGAFFATSQSWVVESRVKIISSTFGPGGFPNTWRAGYGVTLKDAVGRNISLGISDSGVRISVELNLNNAQSSSFIPLDTTSAFRTYRMVVNSSGLELLVDGTLTATLPLGGTSSEINEFFFADGTSSGASQSELSLLRWGVIPSTGTTLTNDDCANATLIGDGVFAFSTAGTTTDGPAEPQLGFCCGDPQVNKDIWFRYTATCSGNVTINLCSATYDSRVAVYSGAACPTAPGSAMAGNDNSPLCTGGGSNLSFPAIAGRSYLIRVGGAANSAGAGTMSISCDSTGCLLADIGMEGGATGRDGILDNNDFIVYINAFFDQTPCP
jgi:hypothetical protein